jgi:hypothetical protein
MKFKLQGFCCCSYLSGQAGYASILLVDAPFTESKPTLEIPAVIDRQRHQFENLFTGDQYRLSPNKREQKKSSG